MIAVNRFKRHHPCPVCGGHGASPRGSGKRCHGFTADGRYAHCSRIPCGDIELGGTWAHRLDGPCRCGTAHDSVGVALPVPDEAPHVARADHEGTWQWLDRRSFVGERYLQNRGLDPVALREVVRFHPRHGSPALALREIGTGNVCGLQYRRVDDGEPKTITARGSRCTGAALHGQLADLEHGTVDVAVVVEGFADTLAAILTWPGCAVFGAAGAGQLARVAGAVATRVRDVDGWLLLVPHDDDEGVRAGIAAARAAREAGLVLDRDLQLPDLGDHKDLADAWRAGWRWSWPDSRDGGGVA